MKIAVEASIRRFIGSGLAVYARNLIQALQSTVGVNVVDVSVPGYLARVSKSPLRKVAAAYWQILHARFVLPVKVARRSADLVHYTMSMPLHGSIGLPRIVTIHDIIPIVHPEWLPSIRGERMRIGIRSTIQTASHIIADSCHTKKDLVELLNVDAGRVSVVHLGPGEPLSPPDPSIASNLFEQKFPGLRNYVLCVGSLEPRKNIARVIEAVASARSSGCSDLALVIVGGDAYLSSELRAKASRCGIEHACVFTGFVADNLLAVLYQRAIAYVSISLYEGFGMTVLEAMSIGTPVITSNTTSLPEVVGDGAICVDPMNSAEVTSAICMLARDEHVRNNLIAKGRLRSGAFSWARCAAETLDVYRSVLRESANAPT